MIANVCSVFFAFIFAMSPMTSWLHKKDGKTAQEEIDQGTSSGMELTGVIFEEIFLKDKSENNFANTIYDRDVFPRWIPKDFLFTKTINDENLRTELSKTFFEIFSEKTLGEIFLAEVFEEEQNSAIKVVTIVSEIASEDDTSKEKSNLIQAFTVNTETSEELCLSEPKNQMQTTTANPMTPEEISVEVFNQMQPPVANPMTPEEISVEVFNQIQPPAANPMTPEEISVEVFNQMQPPAANPMTPEEISVEVFNQTQIPVADPMTPEEFSLEDPCQKVDSEFKVSVVPSKNAQEDLKENTTSPLQQHTNSFNPQKIEKAKIPPSLSLPTSDDTFDTYQSEDSRICEDNFPFYGPTSVFIPYIGYRGGDGRSYRNGYENAGAFLALYNSRLNDYPFLNGNVYRVDGGRLAANVGVGWRKFSSDYDRMLGVNVYYDYRHFSQGHLQDIGLGLELLGKCWDIRVNGYIPFGNKRVLIDTTFFNFPGGFAARRKEYKAAMWGLDVEVGTWLWCIRCIDFYAAAGPYFYHSINCNSLVGGMGRVEARFARYLSLQFLITYDEFFKTKAQGEIVLSLPLPCCIECIKCLFPPVWRNNILIAERACCWKTNF